LSVLPACLLFKKTTCSAFISGLLSTRRIVFTAEETEQILNVNHGTFFGAAERPQNRKPLLK